MPPALYGSFPNAGRVAVGDFNNDAIPDLVATSVDSADLSVGVLLGNGDGTFQDPIYHGVGLRAGALALDDFNGDGLLDVVVPSVGSVPEVSVLHVLLGNGDGSLQDPVRVGQAVFLSALVAGDVNGDGLTDLMAGSRVSARVSVYLNNGDGTFQDPVTYNTGTPPRVLVVGDLNGDGAPDLATSFFAVFGLGDGTFSDPVRITAAGDAMVLTEVNFDGVPDLVCVENLGGVAAVYLGIGDGTFQRARSYVVGFQPSSVAVADFNADGLPDIVTANASSQDLSVLLGNGDGSFQKTEIYLPLARPRFVAAGDFNGDGFDDLAVAAESSVAVLLNDSDWSGPAPGLSRPPAAAWDGVALALSTALFPREELL